MAYFRNFTVSVLATIEIERVVLESRNLEELLGNYDGRVLPCIDYAYQLIMLTVSLSGSSVGSLYTSSGSPKGQMQNNIDLREVLLARGTEKQTLVFTKTAGHKTSFGSVLPTSSPGSSRRKDPGDELGV